jgi:hypothetical protein
VNAASLGERQRGHKKKRPSELAPGLSFTSERR